MNSKKTVLYFHEPFFLSSKDLEASYEKFVKKTSSVAKTLLDKYKGKNITRLWYMEGKIDKENVFLVSDITLENNKWSFIGKNTKGKTEDIHPKPHDGCYNDVLIVADKPKKCKFHPEYKALKKPSSKKAECSCMEVFCWEKQKEVISLHKKILKAMKVDKNSVIHGEKKNYEPLENMLQEKINELTYLRGDNI